MWINEVFIEFSMLTGCWKYTIFLISSPLIMADDYLFQIKGHRTRLETSLN